MTPEKIYQDKVVQGSIQEDSAQRRAICLLNKLHKALMAQSEEKAVIKWLVLFFKLLFFKKKKSASVQGIYMWGGVGRGKTFLMDIFHDSLSIDKKMRTHFHRFMRDIHEQLRINTGASEPLKIVAGQIAKEVKVLCFDEFFVLDIGDAMILGNLLEVLFNLGVILVITSNVPPNRLYENGLQRSRFLPTIALIETRMAVINVDEGVDYRLQKLTHFCQYYTPITDENIRVVDNLFHRLVPDTAQMHINYSLEVSGRRIEVYRLCDPFIWFTFDALCNSPRGVQDYIDLAAIYSTWFISGVPKFVDNMDDQARRFIYLVDVCYEYRVKLVLCAEVPLDQLYTTGALAFEFLRTVSRLIEMQSQQYLSFDHGLMT